MKGAIMTSGGGGTKLFAAIGVTYPAGSTLTCTNGTKTLTAKTTSGQWVFAIPETGTWTVTATQGTNTKSQSVSITSEGQFESVELSYQLVIIENGYDKVGLTTKGNVYEHDSDFDGGYYVQGEAYYEVDVTKYKTLTFDSRFYTYGNGNGSPTVEVRKTSNSKISSQTVTQTKTTYTIDLSAITGVVRIWWGEKSYQDGVGAWHASRPIIYDMLLE